MKSGGAYDDVLAAIKKKLDPHGILAPGRYGIPPRRPASVYCACISNLSLKYQRELHFRRLSCPVRSRRFQPIVIIFFAESL